jgi:hypothetical protein
MIIFVKKIKTKEGINSFDSDKIKNDIPAGYKASVQEPIITLTANHVMIAYKCEKIEKPAPKPKTKKQAKTKAKTKEKPKSK